MQPERHILIVEDERDLAELIALNLRRAGFSVETLHDGRAGLAQATKRPPDLLILDLMLPGLPGQEVARGLRTNPATAGLPILMLTAKAEEADQVAGLALGADDYVTKPFSMKVLLARVEALLRRPGVAGKSAGPLRVGPIEADLDAHRISVNGDEVQFTLTEFKLLVALLQAPGKVLHRNDLIARVMGPGIVITTRTIDVHIAAIRRKLGSAGGMVRTSRGVGYSLVSEGRATPASA
jgi:two-component system, OmpR family, phosphate regulon response regulator PhoB